ncbi:MAG: ankyrin repeat domain-containing protein [Rhodospirillaceae bacterium]|nr:ankyrin repeat domain-containing protein [Rhodospirillaceae bacterium]
MFIDAKRAGMDFGAASRRRELPIHAAAASESTESSPSEVIRWLVLDAGQNPDALTGYGLAPLHIACLRRDPARVQALIDLGADPNAASPRGWTPLHAACSASVPDVATALVRAGADRGLVTDRGVTPRDLAALRNERIRASQRTMRMLAPA